MAHHQNHEHDSNINTTTLATPSHNAVPSTLHLSEEEPTIDVDEPPDRNVKMTFKRQPIRSPTLSLLTSPMDGSIDANKQKSLLTKGLSSEIPYASRPRSLISSLSSASTAELTSDGGLTSPARTSTPSPPFPPAIGLNFPTLVKKLDTVTLSPVEAPRKRCITFACGKPAQKVEEVKKPETEVKKPCTIKWACPTKPKEIEQKSQSKSGSTQSTPRRSSSRASFSKDQSFREKRRHSEALRFHEFASSHLQDDEWVHKKSSRQSKLTINDTLRKENEYRKLGEEVAAEAREAELEEDEEAMNAEDDDEEEEEEEEDLDEDESESDVDSDGNVSDNEEGFADSDDDSDGSGSEYQFWTYHNNTAATSTEHVILEINRLKTRSPSASSIESAVFRNEIEKQRPHGKHRRQPKMRPGTPELPDSTDFVCGTLDEDRPLEAAYLACMAQKKAAKRAVIPQDLDPTFPTSDAEVESDEEEDDDNQADSHDGFWSAGQFDNFSLDHSVQNLRTKGKPSTRSPSMSPKRRKSPCPITRNRILAHTPPPTGRLFGKSPTSRRDTMVESIPSSPQTSRHPSYDDRSMEIPMLAQRPNMTVTKSLPRTPNPFWMAHGQQQKDIAGAISDNGEVHSRGPIDIIQGLENKRRRRKEKYWLTHCRKEAKEREKEKERRRHLPGRGAKRMRELGLEAADRCKGYGQRAPVVLSI